MSEQWPFLGKHVLGQFEGIDAGLLDDEPALRATLLDALAETGLSVLDVMGKSFEPQGVTLLALLAESHASIHTYPEHGSMFVDVFTCGERCKPDLAVQRLAAALNPTTTTITVTKRGGETTQLDMKETPWTSSKSPLLPASPVTGSLVTSGIGEARPSSVLSSPRRRKVSRSSAMTSAKARS